MSDQTYPELVVIEKDRGKHYIIRIGNRVLDERQEIDEHGITAMRMDPKNNVCVVKSRNIPLERAVR